MQSRGEHRPIPARTERDSSLEALKQITRVEIKPMELRPYSAPGKMKNGSMMKKHWSTPGVRDFTLKSFKCFERAETPQSRKESKGKINIIDTYR